MVKLGGLQEHIETADTDGASLVIAATDDSDLQKKIAQDARARKIWVNIVDVPPLCDRFIAPWPIREPCGEMCRLSHIDRRARRRLWPNTPRKKARAPHRPGI